MARTYETAEKLKRRASPPVAQTAADFIARTERLITEHYPDFQEAGLTIDLICAFSDDDGPALKHQGRECLGLAKKTSYENRVKGMADVSISIDFAKYHEMPLRQRDALLHHELHHFIIERDQEGAIKYDKANRPKVAMRPHDHEVGWFVTIAERYGADSHERIQAAQAYDDFGQAFWPDLFKDVTTLEDAERRVDQEVARDRARNSMAAIAEPLKELQRVAGEGNMTISMQAGDGPEVVIADGTKPKRRKRKAA